MTTDNKTIGQRLASRFYIVFLSFSISALYIAGNNSYQIKSNTFLFINNNMFISICLIVPIFIICLLTLSTYWPVVFSYIILTIMVLPIFPLLYNFIIPTSDIIISVPYFDVIRVYSYGELEQVLFIKLQPFKFNLINHHGCIIDFIHSCNGSINVLNDKFPAFVQHLYQRDLATLHEAAEKNKSMFSNPILGLILQAAIGGTINLVITNIWNKLTKYESEIERDEE